MKLEDMQNVWSQMSNQLEQQKQLTDAIIMEMTQQKYKNRFSTLSFYEITGAIICVLAALYILANLDKMNTWYLITCSLLASVSLLALPVFSLRALFAMKNLNITQNTYKDTLVDFIKKKKHVLLVQKVGAVYSVILMWLVAPVFSMAANNKDLFQQEHSIGMLVFYAAITLGVLWFARWGFNCYKRITARAAADLQQLEQIETN